MQTKKTFLINRANKLYIIMLILGILFLLIIISKPTLAENINSGFEFWKSFKYNFAENVPVWNVLNDDTSEGSNMMLFYPLEDWEIQVCSRGLTSATDTNKVVHSSKNPFNIKLSSVTTALAASKYSYISSQDIIYNLEWYIQSIDNELIYSVYLIDSKGNRFNIDDYTDVSLAPMTSSTKVLPVLYSVNYTVLAMEYHLIDSSDIQIIKTEIIDDTKAKYG